jgi:hypothetical protein
VKGIPWQKSQENLKPWRYAAGGKVEEDKVASLTCRMKAAFRAERKEKQQ